MKFIFGDESYFINKNLNEIKSMYSLDQIIVLDENYEFSELIELIAMETLFVDKKLIIVKNLDLIETTKYNKKQQQNAELLIKTLVRFSDSNEVVFVYISAKMANNMLTSFLNQNATLYECKKIPKKEIAAQLLLLCKEKNIKFSYTDINLFLDKMPDNLEIIMNEFNNLTQTYQTINFEVINLVIAKYAKNEVFSFLNSIDTFNLATIYQKYLERISEGEEITSLIAQLSTILSNCVNYYYLIASGLNNMQITEKLKQPLWKIRKLSTILNNFGFKKLKNVIYELGKLDILSKTSGVNVNELFEIFLVKNF